jgi:serine/threonine protein kinase
MLSQLGPYRIVRELPAIYSGCVYEAFDQSYSRKVTLTECPAIWPAEEILQRLELEARTSALLNHPNIARVFGFIRRDEHVYLVTEFLQGATLEKILVDRRRMPPALAVNLFRQIFSGVAAAHRSGVIHGDLRPANVLVPDFGPVKILNLAFAHAFRDGSQVAGNAGSRYLAPEQLRGESPDARSDIYSLGLVLYQTIVGESPFERYVNSAAGSTAQLQFIPAPPSMVSADIPKSIDELLLQMIAPDPSKRFQSMRAVTRFLDCAPGVLENSELSVSRGRFPARAASRRRPQSKGYPGSVVSPKWVSAIGFFVLIAAEMFLFRGENISELTEKRIQSRPSLNESVDAMFSRIGTEPITVDHEPARERSPAVPRKVARRDARVTERVSARIESASIEIERASTRAGRETAMPQQSLSVATPQRRAAEAINLKRETTIAATEALHREEPAQVRSIPNNTPVPRLKVEWEN